MTDLFQGFPHQDELRAAYVLGAIRARDGVKLLGAVPEAARAGYKPGTLESVVFATAYCRNLRQPKPRARKKAKRQPTNNMMARFPMGEGDYGPPRH